MTFSAKSRDTRTVEAESRSVLIRAVPFAPNALLALVTKLEKWTLVAL